MNRLKKVFMVGPSLKTRGGISTVLDIYNRNFRYAELHFISSYSGRNRLLDMLFFLQALLRVFIVAVIYKDTIFHINTASGGSFFRKSIITRIVLFYGRKVVFHIHGGGFKDFIENSEVNKKKKIISLLGKANRIIVLSEVYKDFISRYLSREIITVLYNPCPVIDDTGYKTRNNQVTRILYTGRLSAAKGIYDLLEAAGRLERDFCLEIYGDGELEKVRSLVNRSKLKGKTAINSWVPNCQVLKLFRSADIFVLPSYVEGMPMSILEAMASGLPVISTNVGGIPEAVRDNENGFLLNPGDIAGLTEKLELLVNDRALREKMGRKSLEFAKASFSMEIVGEELKNIYEAL